MKIFVTCLLIGLSHFVYAQKDSSRATAILKEGTIYYGYGAELTHAAKVQVSKNTKYIIIDNISTQLELNSLQVSCPENISLLSQQFVVHTPTAPSVSINTLGKKIMDSISLKQDEIAILQNKILIDEATLSATGKLIESTIATSTSKTSLTAEVLKLIDFYNNKIEKNKKEIFQNNQLIKTLTRQLNEMNARLKEINAEAYAALRNGGPDLKSYGRLILQVLCRADQQADVALSYYTKNAGWQPLYDIRVDTKTNSMKLVYKASIIQNTGIDWTNTKLSLSTGTPNFTTIAPVFSAWYLQFFAPELSQQLEERAGNLRVLNSIGYAQKASADKIVSTDDNYKYEEANIEPSTLNDFASLRQGMLHTIFDIALPYDISSNGQPHNINIKEEKLSSTLKNYAIPKLDPEPYLLAALTDWQNLDLIPGNANIIMDDTYIGRSFIDPNSTADTLNLSLGKDKRVVVKRTAIKVADASKTKDKNIIQTFTYEITVKNNKIKDIELLLKDQFPISTVKEIEVELTDDGGATLTPEVGALNWQVSLKPGEIKKFRFTYTVKYPKDKKIANLR